MCKDIISFQEHFEFQCCDQHKNIGRTQKVFFFLLLLNTKLIISCKNVIYPFMDNAVIRRLCNLLLRSYFLSSLDLCSFICKMKEVEDNFRAFVRILDLAAGLISLSLCTPICLPPTGDPPLINVPLP